MFKKTQQIIFISITFFLTGCGGGALLNVNPNEPQIETKFCGVSLKFSGNPRNMNENEIKPLRDSYGNYENYKITGLLLDKYHLSEAAYCICGKIHSFGSEINFNQSISPTDGSKKYIDRVIDGIGIVKSWDSIISPLHKYRYQFTNPSAEPACHFIQIVQVPENSNDGINFLNSLSAIGSNDNSLPKITLRERLMQLDALKKDGLITQSEYDSKKKIILNSL